MIIQSQKNTIESSTFDASIPFQLQADSYLFELLTSKVYKYPIDATVREISTNAIDSCLEAELPVRFHVHLPTIDEPFFSVRDYGNGMQPDIIESLYCTMGASSKRDSNQYNGAMGLGKLAPLSYANSFTITSYYNSTSYSYLVSTTNGIPTLIPMGTYPTTEPNGLLVSVPVLTTDIEQFFRAASKIYRYFTHKPTFNVELTDIEPNTTTTGCDEWFFDTVDFIKYNNYILMANVLYEIPSSSSIKTYGLTGLIMRAPTGAVSINPGRETLSLDKPTIDFINQSFTNVQTEYIDIINSITDDPDIAPLPKAIAIAKLLSNTTPTIASQYDCTTLSALLQVPLQMSYNDLYIAGSPVGIALKRYHMYYKHPKSLDSFIPNIPILFNLPIMIMDISQHSASALKSFGQHALLLTRPAGISMQQFLINAKEWLSSIGVTDYYLASNYLHPSLLVTTSSKSATTSRTTGIYGGTFYYGSCSMAQLLDPNTPYFYIPVSGTKPELAASVTANIYQARSIFSNCGITIPQIVGIPKKYLSLVKDNPNFTPAVEGLQSVFDQHRFISYDAQLRQEIRIRPTNPPQDLFNYLLALDSFADNFNRSTYIVNTDVAKVTDIFAVNHTPFTLPVTLEELEQKYPLFYTLRTAYPSSDAVTQISYYFSLEACHDTSRTTS